MKLTKTCARFLRKNGGTLLAIGASHEVQLLPFPWYQQGSQDNRCKIGPYPKTHRRDANR